MRKDTHQILVIGVLLLSFLAGSCKKDNRKDPPKLVSYKIRLITGSNTYINYFYNDAGLLSVVDGVDRAKGITANITYDLDRVVIDYRNRTANEVWLIKMRIDPETGYILEYDDGLYIASFKYDSLIFEDGVKRLVSSHYSGGRYEGDSLFFQTVYDTDGTLLSCSHRGEVREFEYFKDVEYESIINTNFPEAALGRFERIIGYLPYTFGPPQKYLVKRQRTPGSFDFRYSYVKDEFGRVKQMVLNGAAVTFNYLEE
jgi:hypothetical protein